jgi:hypothetical protein
MLLIAKAQYKVRKSDSLLPGTVEKLAEIFIRQPINKALVNVLLPSVLSLASAQELQKPFSI